MLVIGHWFLVFDFWICGNLLNLRNLCAIKIAKFNEKIEVDMETSVVAAKGPAEKMSTRFEPKIVAFLCNWCSYAGADLAGVSRLPSSPNIRVVRTMCSGRVDPAFIMRAWCSTTFAQKSTVATTIAKARSG